MTREPTEMEIRVAKAIVDAMTDGNTSVDLARAAIRAMREPTKGMWEAASATGTYGGIADNGAIEADDFDPETVWTAMIDAASPPERDTE